MHGANPLVFDVKCNITVRPPTEPQIWVRRWIHGNFESFAYQGTLWRILTCRLNIGCSRTFQSARMRSGDSSISIRSKTCGAHCLFQYRQTSLHDHDSLSAALQMYLKSSGGSNDAELRARDLHLGGRAVGVKYSGFSRTVLSTDCNSCQLIHVSSVTPLELLTRTLGHHPLHLHPIRVQSDSSGQNLSAHHSTS